MSSVNEHIEIQQGKFIVLEGLDGSGKSTQARRLTHRLREDGLNAVLSFEPTSGPIGSIVRQIITGRVAVDPRTLAALFAADRLDHIYNSTNGVLKHLGEGKIEVSDRYDLTSYAYQTRFASEDWIYQLNSQVIRPHFTVFLDVDPQECHRRIIETSGDDELFHDVEHLAEARERYFLAIKTLRAKDQIVVIAGDGSPEKIGDSVYSHVTEFLRSCGILDSRNLKSHS